MSHRPVFLIAKFPSAGDPTSNTPAFQKGERLRLVHRHDNGWIEIITQQNIVGFVSPHWVDEEPQEPVPAPAPPPQQQQQQQAPPPTQPQEQPSQPSQPSPPQPQQPQQSQPQPPKPADQPSKPENTNINNGSGTTAPQPAPQPAPKKIPPAIIVPKREHTPPVVAFNKQVSLESENRDSVIDDDEDSKTEIPQPDSDDEKSDEPDEEASKTRMGAPGEKPQPRSPPVAMRKQQPRPIIQSNRISLDFSAELASKLGGLAPHPMGKRPVSGLHPKPDTVTESDTSSTEPSSDPDHHKGPPPPTAKKPVRTAPPAPPNRGLPRVPSDVALKLVPQGSTTPEPLPAPQTPTVAQPTPVTSSPPHDPLPAPPGPVSGLPRVALPNPGGLPRVVQEAPQPVGGNLPRVAMGDPKPAEPLPSLGGGLPRVSQGQIQPVPGLSAPNTPSKQLAPPVEPEGCESSTDIDPDDDTASTVSPTQQPILQGMEGYLDKKVILEEGKDSKKRSWIQLFVVLTGSSLYFFKDERDKKKGKKPLGFLPIHGKTVGLCSPEHTKRKFCFIIENDLDKVAFQASDEQAMQMWMDSITAFSKDQRPVLTVASKTTTLRSNRISTPNLGEEVNKNTSPVRPQSMVSPKPSSTPSTPAQPEAQSGFGFVRKKLNQYLGARPKREELKQKGIMEDTVFGSTIADLVRKESTLFPGVATPNIPIIVTKCVAIVDEHLTEQGIYRLSGNSASVQRLVAKANENVHQLDLSTTNDIHTVTGLLKLFFRELSDPIFTETLYPEFIVAGKVGDKQARVAAIKAVFVKLPAPNKITLKFLFEHLNRVAHHEAVNKMQINNLAIVFGPTLLRQSEPSLESIVMDAPYQNGVVEELIRQMDFFFDS